jgi:regulator of sigma E protease
LDFLGLVSGAGGFLWTVVSFIVALSIIVFVHEYGHYIIGRWTGIHAEVFSLGFGPVLYSRVDRRGTRWQVAALPFGGYVKFMGDADASSRRDEGAMTGLSKQELRHTMHGAPLWARALTVLAGPVFNFILTIVVFIGVVAWTGVALDKPVVGEMRAVPFATSVGGASLQPGDQIVAVNGTATPDLAAYGTVVSAIGPAPSVTYLVERGGVRVEVVGPHPMPPIAASVQPQSAAMDAGLKAGDVILSANGQAVNSFAELPPIVKASDGAPVSLQVWRAGETFDLTLTPRRRDLPTETGFETRWLIGLSGGLLFEFEARQPGPLETVGLALDQTWYVATTSLSGLWHIATGAISSCNISGPIGMAEVMGDAARSGLETFVQMLAVLSLGIGLLNLFPIPVLDGGHLVFHVWEAATGKPPSDKALQVLMSVGLALLLSLMVFAISNDLFCT